MVQKLPLFFLPICALLLYADAMPNPKLERTLSRKRTSAMPPEEASKMFEKQTKPSKKMAKVSSEVSSKDLGGHKVDSIGQHTENIGGQNVEQPGTPQIEEHAIASTSESMDPKSQLEELLEMNVTLMWEMAVRSEDDQITMSVPEYELITDLEDEQVTDLEDGQITDLEDELITDLEVEQIIEQLRLEDELIADLEDEQIIDTDDDMLQWFPTFIFMKLEKFLPNVPQGDGQHKAELSKLVASWKAETEQTAQIEQIVNSLDMYRMELRDRIMPGVKLTSPVVKILLNQGINNSHAEEKKAFLKKMGNKMPTSYANKFFGSIEIATAYLNQAVEIGQWAQNSDFLKSAQLENLPKLVEQNLSELANLRDAMAVKLGIDLAKIDMPKLMAKSSPSLDNIFTRNLPEKHAEIKDIAQREKAKISDAQIAAVHLLAALRAACYEVAALSVEQSVDIEHETAHVKKIENNLDTYREELRKRIMTGVNGVTPAVLDTLLDQGINDSHAEEKNAFLWKMVIQKPTRYVKNVGQFFGGIEIATAYLNQAVEIGQLAQNFLKSAQLENLPKLVEQNLSELANLRDAMAVKLGIDLAKIDMPKLMAENSPSLDNIFTRNLPEKHAEIKDIAQSEEAKINDAQIAAENLFTALSAASTEVAALEAELLGIKITWRAFQTVGDVSKMAQILQQIR
uniref:Uncharacterized protein n=1 Tax=Globodera rostochiensis TaxID=31243 RepID=A0A914H1Q3_GLORO